MKLKHVPIPRRARALHALSTVFLSSSLLVGCGEMTGSGRIITQRQSLSAVRAVELKTGGELTIRQGPTRSFSIETDDNIAPMIQTTVQDNKLIISARPGADLSSATELRYQLVVNDLSAITIEASGDVKVPELHAKTLTILDSGSGSASVDRLGAERVRVQIGGSGGVKLADVRVNTIEAELRGSAKLEVGGQTQSQTVSVIGSGNYSALALASDDATIRLMGSGSASIECARSLTALVSGAGSLTYSGSPMLNTSISGSGTVRQAATAAAP